MTTFSTASRARLRRARPFRPWPLSVADETRYALRDNAQRRALVAGGLGGTGGLLAAAGAAACPLPTRGIPPVAGAAAAPMPRTRSPAVLAATFPHRCVPARTGRAVLHAPGSLSPRKITAQGRAFGASPLARRKPLTVIFPGKTSAPIGRTGADCRGCWMGCVSRRFPPPAVVVLADNRFAVLGYSVHAVVSLRTVLTCLVAVARRGQRVARRRRRRTRRGGRW